MRALGIVLAVLLGLVVVADRVLVGVAERTVGRELVRGGLLEGEPEVDITGFPFLPQAIAGRYDEVRISLSADQLGQPEGTRADVVLRGAEAPLADVLSGTVEELPVERIDGTVILSYALLSAELGNDTTLEREGEQLRITGTIDVFGEELPLTALGQVTVEDDELVIEVDSAEGAGVEMPDSVVDRAGEFLDLRYPVPELPFGLRLIDVEPAEDGVAVRLAADGTVLRALE